MPIIALTYPPYTDLKTLPDILAEAAGLRMYTDSQLMERTAVDHGIAPEVLAQVVQVAPIAFNTFTHEREKILAALEKTLSRHIASGNCLFSGIICQLIPDQVSHIFRILALSSKENRIRTALRTEGCPRSCAEDLIRQADEDALRWGTHSKNRSPWEKSFYHLVLDMDAGGPADLEAARIQAAINKAPFSGRTPREREVADLKITTEVHMALACLGDGLTTDTIDGQVTVTLDKKRMNLPQTQARIKEAVKAIPGVVSLKIKIGPRYYESDMIRTFDFDSSNGPWKWGGSK